MISNEVRKHIQDIGDMSVRAQLTHLVEVLQLLDSGQTDLGGENFVQAFNRTVEGYQGANAAQRESISRLLDERRRNLSEIAQLHGEVKAWETTYGVKKEASA